MFRWEHYSFFVVYSSFRPFLASLADRRPLGVMTLPFFLAIGVDAFWGDMTFESN